MSTYQFYAKKYASMLGIYNNQLCRHTSFMLKSMPACLEYSILYTLQIWCRSDYFWIAFLNNIVCQHMVFCSRQYSTITPLQYPSMITNTVVFLVIFVLKPVQQSGYLTYPAFFTIFVLCNSDRLVQE